MTFAMTRHRLFLAGIAVLALIGGIMLGNTLLRPPPPAPEIAGIFLPEPRPLPDFELIHETGRPFTRADFEGRWTFIYFGYTYCPDACPMTLAQLNIVDRQLKESNADSDTHYLLISVDPRRDTPERLAEYTKFFNPDFQGATGEPEQLDRLTAGMGVLYRVPSDPDDPEHYLVDHSSTVLIVNPEGALQAVFTPPQDPTAMANDFRMIRDYHRSYH